ncbi:olfactory receptor 1D2-like [Thamnophis elegans]|uniref:olfactory receptor 1D2-like n=1 Tax=Thamnophis elegans TaxID=35005 RepID=UPI00137871BA|nr:olfactory receptor 1D2-like [Thamnophis elegans]
MEISKLLAEKEELKVQIQELIKENHQLAKEKEELCEEYKEYKEKMSRKISSEELGQLEKLRQENERLRCKAQKEAAEKAELLHENNDLKEELYRKIAVMSKLTVESEELRNKTEILMFKNIELTDEKEEIFRAYEEILCRKELLRIGRCTLLTDRDQMEDKTEAQEKMKPQMAEYQLNSKWLKALVDKIKKSKEPGSNILRWLQKSLKLLKEDSSERSKHTLPEWLKASATNLPEECAKAAREDDVSSTSQTSYGTISIRLPGIYISCIAAKKLPKNKMQTTKMDADNFTSETGFILLGLASHRYQCIVLFVVFLTMYLLTVLGNLLIIILVHMDAQLHTPMYFFLSHLASLDILYVTCSLPQTLLHLLSGKGVVSSIGCILQGGSALSLGCTECLLLGVMAYDRYLAICNPLRYTSAMDRKHQHLLAISCWIIGCILSTVTIVCVFRHSFCGSNHINHFFCELRFLLALACDDVKRTTDILNALSVFTILIPFSVILCSYCCIVHSIFQMQSIAGRYKVFSTCGSHLIVVTLFYGTIISIYITPHSSSSDKNKKVAVMYLAVTPLLNPIIYTLRNKDIHRAVIKVLRGRNFEEKT